MQLQIADERKRERRRRGRLRDDPLRHRRAGRDHHAEPARAAEHDRAADARRGRGGRRARHPRRRGQGDRAARRRPGVLRAATTSAAASSTGTTRSRPTARWDPGKDFAFATTPQVSPTQKLMSVWRCTEAGDRPGPRLVRRRRQRLRALRRPRGRKRGRGIGTPYSRMWGAYFGHVDLPARPRKGEVPRAHRQAAAGREAADVELINEAVPFAGSSRAGRARSPPSSPRSRPPSSRR